MRLRDGRLDLERQHGVGIHLRLGMPLLERGAQVAELHAHLAEAAGGRGRVVFVSGEAGSGKSTLIEHFTSSLEDGIPTIVRSCDALTLPGPFGPLFDLADALGPEVQSLLRSQAARDELFRAVLTALQDAGGANVIVGEDAHWTDEATIELIRFLGRRIGSTRTLFLVTYRADALGSYHPLRRVLGDLVNEPGVFRMALPPLTVDAVAELAAGSGLDPLVLHERTAGNPFYVTEIVAAGGDTIPDTVFDAVLARAAPLPDDARAVLDTGAILGDTFDPDLLEAVIGSPVLDPLDACLAEGILRSKGRRIAFRHGLVADVLRRAMSLPRRRALHRRVLGILENEPGFTPDLALLAHHADKAGDDGAVLRYAPAAAREATAFGAHRQAAEQYARALRHAEGLPDTEVADLLEARSVSCYVTGLLDEAISECRRAIEIRQRAGESAKAGADLRWLSRFHWFAGQNAEAEQCARDALQLLEPLSASADLAMAYSNIAQLRMLADDEAGATHWGRRAITMATSLGDDAIRAHALINVGTAQFKSGQLAGKQMIEEGMAIAAAHGMDDDVARAQANLAWTSLDQRDLSEAERIVGQALAFTAERDLPVMELYLRTIRGRTLTDRGDWDAAWAEMGAVVARPGATALVRIVALTVLGLVAARQGGDASGPLDEALTLAGRTAELMRLGPVRAARAEAAWLAGDPTRAVAEAQAAHLAARDRGDRWLAGNLALWIHRGGQPVSDVALLAEPFALEITGAGIEAARQWRERGYPLEEARALASTGDRDQLLAAAAITERLGAKPDTARIARALREFGVAIPRGPRAVTRSNPAKLTARELELVPLLAAGWSNRRIAESLYLSPRTVGHHVSAILRKLEINSRSRVNDRLVELGHPTDGSSPTAR